ncbi:MAG TPA: extracellular solute-binding protein [Stellaceae bacterium]|jgi:iron(III) transport system substrate-binding protein|nr:extracellular solute-binding protein [Stellaceae bacterium]
MKRLWIILLAGAAAVAAAIVVVWPSSRQSLVLYSAVDYGQPVAEAFTRETGIPVTVIPISTGPLLAKVSAEGTRPGWSLIWFDGDEAMAALDTAGLIAKDTTPELPWTAMGKSLVPADGAWTPTGISLAGVFSYRGSLATPPATWSDLLKPQFAGLVGMNNPTISGPMFPLLAGLLSDHGGWTAGQDFMLGLHHNGLHIYPRNDDTLAALEAGDIKVAVTQSSAAWFSARSDASMRVVIPEPAYVLPSTIATAASLSGANLKAAKEFIRFVMRPDIQQLRIEEGGGDGLFWPLTTDVTTRDPALPALDTLHLERVDPSYWGAKQPEISRWFSTAMVGE